MRLTTLVTGALHLLVIPRLTDTLREEVVSTIYRSSRYILFMTHKEYV
jgi:hypothetical protein